MPAPDLNPGTHWPKRAPVVIVLHVNHPNEIDADVRAACGRLRAAGATLLDQSVLLAGVNDDVDLENAPVAPNEKPPAVSRRGFLYLVDV